MESIASCRFYMFRRLCGPRCFFFFFFNDTATTEIYTLSLHDALPIWIAPVGVFALTWHNNFTTSGARAPENPGGVVPNHSLNGVTEWAYGVTHWFEAGLYLPLYTATSDGAVLVDGFKLRMLLVSPDAGQRHFFY